MSGVVKVLHRRMRCGLDSDSCMYFRVASFVGLMGFSSNLAMIKRIQIFAIYPLSDRPNARLEYILTLMTQPLQKQVLTGSEGVVKALRLRLHFRRGWLC